MIILNFNKLYNADGLQQRHIYVEWQSFVYLIDYQESG